MSLHKLCNKCRLCTFMPESEKDPQLVIPSGERAKVLVVDDRSQYGEGINIAIFLFGAVPFDYSYTIRCEHNAADLDEKQKDTALYRCSVWTKTAATGYAIHLLTKKAMNQLSIGWDKKEGDVFVNGRFGLVLCIEPLGDIGPETSKEYSSKVQRLLKKAGIK